MIPARWIPNPATPAVFPRWSSLGLAAHSPLSYLTAKNVVGTFHQEALARLLPSFLFDVIWTLSPAVPAGPFRGMIKAFLARGIPRNLVVRVS